MRNKTTGCKGDCVLYYDRATGRYLDARHGGDALAAIVGAGASSGESNGAAAAAAAPGGPLVLTADGTPLAPIDDADVLQKVEAAQRAMEQLAAVVGPQPTSDGASDDADALREAHEAACDAASGLAA